MCVCRSEGAVKEAKVETKAGATSPDPKSEKQHDKLRKKKGPNPDSKSEHEFFNLMDSNHDGYISPSEYNSGLTLLLDTLSSKQKKFGFNLGNSFTSNSNSNSNQRTQTQPLEDLSFLSAFFNSVAMILATEIGDKTFFIAAVLSMRNERFVVFSGAISALVVMTVLSSMMGLVLPSVLPRQYTHLIGGLLFLYFGTRLLLDSRNMSANKCSDELEEVEHELNPTSNKKKEDIPLDLSLQDKLTHQYNPTQPIATQKLFLQAFTLTFLAEWGDRSQIATIALAAAKDPWGVNIGAILGHTLCTGMAVLGGRMLAASISEKTVTIWGAIIFLLFGLHSLFIEQI